MPQKQGVMTMMMIKKQTKFYKLLIGYWFATAFLFFSYAGLTCLNQQISFQELLTTVPTFSLGFLLSCMMLVMGVMLSKMDKRETSRKSMFGKFILFAFIQQLLTFNIIGAILSGVIIYVMPNRESERQSLMGVTKLVMGVLLVLSLLLGLISFNVFNR